MMANMRYLYNETFCAEIIMMMIIIKNNDLKGKCYHFTCIELPSSSSSKTRISDQDFFSCKNWTKWNNKKKSHRSFFSWWKKKKKSTYNTWNGQILEFFFSIYSWYVWGSHPDKCQALVFCFYIYCLTYLTIFFVLVVFSWSIRDRI
mgnify:CR=1 FL=1